MTVAIDPFNIQFDFGVEGATEDTARYAEVWDGPIQVAILMRIGDEWVVDHFDTDYAELHGTPNGWETVVSFVNFLNESGEE